MGATLAEKMISASAGRDSVRPGDEVEVRPDGFVFNEETADDVFARVENPTEASGAARVSVLPDRFARRRDSAAAGVYARLADLARRAPVRMGDIGRSGVTAVEAIDRGLVGPGMIVVTTDFSHLGGGALGALITVADVDACARAVSTGTIRVVVPKTVRLEVTGAPGRWVSGFDVAVHAAAALGGLSADHVVEAVGETMDRLDAIERIAFAQGFAQVDGTRVLLSSDERTLAFLRARAAKPPATMLPDRDAIADREVRVSVDGLTPIAFPWGRLADAKRLSALPEMPVHQVVIGGHAGGRVEDLRTAAQLLKEHPVCEGVRLIIAPATPRSYLHAIEEGLIAALLRAGAVVVAPTSGLCRGDGTTLGAGERGLSTAGIGENPPDDGELWLASPAVCAATAAAGRIAHPDEVMRRKREAV